MLGPQEEASNAKEKTADRPRVRMRIEASLLNFGIKRRQSDRKANRLLPLALTYSCLTKNIYILYVYRYFSGVAPGQFGSDAGEIMLI